MNTFQNLIDNGIEPYTAQDMLDGYSKRIGTMNGVYEIIDITYDFDNKGKDVTLRCSLCGKEIHRLMFNGRNKWSELIKSCKCQKIAKEKADFEIAEKIKKEKIETIKSRVGKQYGDYEIVFVEDLENSPKYTMKCIECGAEKIISATNFDKRTNFHCGKHYVQPIKFDDSYIGKKKNYLKVIGITRFDGNNHRAFLCECDCGNLKEVEPIHWERGIVKSCGCKRSEILQSLHDNHSKDRLYRVYRNMIDRCYSEKSDNYRNYGGRGITICDEWLNDYFAFKNWAANGYDENAEFGECTIDRINVNGNYEPYNCRWISNAEQQKNKRPSCEWKKRDGNIEFLGKVRTMDSICKEYGVSEPFVRYRMTVLGMSLLDALTVPKMTSGRPRKEI